MDFGTASAVSEALQRAVQDGVFGYLSPPTAHRARPRALQPAEPHRHSLIRLSIGTDLVADLDRALS